ncbi:hypothetical protein C1646_766424 [Rhizophagus diaphanus]|nr:hypothetical protein C1646_766424 [Rhizophagus diaphanus] [Rhizophagus sp. MUCL 43196]
MYTFVNFFSQSFYQSNQTNPIRTSLPSPTTSSTLHECVVCKASYRKAINEFKAQLVHIIQGKLKGHFSQSGKQTISLPCLESLFFGVFEGYIHYYNYQTGSYKCFFQDPDTYIQQTFVVLFDAWAEADANQEIEWKYKKSKEDAKNNRTSVGYINLKFRAQQI